MAWIRAMGGTSDDNILKIYEDGTQYMSLESPGSYTAGEPTTPATFLSDHISVVNGSNNVCITGIVIPIDVTDYAAVHVISKHNSGGYGVSVYLNGNKASAGYDTRTTCGTANTYHETVLNITSFSGNKYIFILTDGYNTNDDIKEIWLSKV